MEQADNAELWVGAKQLPGCASPSLDFSEPELAQIQEFVLLGSGKVKDLFGRSPWINEAWRFWDENPWSCCPMGTCMSPLQCHGSIWAGSGDSGLGHRDFSASWWNMKRWLSFWEQPWLSLPPGVTVIKVIKKERYEVTKAIEAVKSMLPNPNPWRLKLRLPQIHKSAEIFVVCETTKPYTSVCKQVYLSRSGICTKQDYHKKSGASCTLFSLHFVSALLPVGS